MSEKPADKKHPEKSGDSLVEKVHNFPTLAGVYLMRDKTGKVIYVGKASNLRSRVSSYFRTNTDARHELLVSRINDIDYILTGTEIEALITENRLIKEYQPKYNVNLKDDKTYPYLKITSETYPRLELIRLPEKKEIKETGPVARSAVYFGPYTEVRAVRKTVRFLGRLFPLRTCKQPLTGKEKGRPCLNYQMKLCLGPCRGNEAVTPEEYGELVDQIVLFLKGRQNHLEKTLTEQMNEAAEKMDFESAVVCRDRLDYLKKTVENRRILALPEGDYDVVTLIRVRDEILQKGIKEQVSVYMYRVREGCLQEREHFVLSGTVHLPDDEIITGFIKSYYSRGVLFPGEIICPLMPAESELLQEWLSNLYNRKLKISFPNRGPRKELLERCLQEGFILAKEKFQRSNKIEREKEKEALAALSQLQELTGLAAIKRIEGYDISHLRGGESVGAMVVFQDGFSFRGGYRRFRIAGKTDGDDCGAMKEVISRRFEKKEIPFPDLILADGGAGQLNAVIKTLQEKELYVPVIALAKKQEEIYLPGRKEPVSLPGNSPALNLLQRIRDEAHRFAINYHRSLRSRDASLSVIDSIPGIGSKRKNSILRHFNGINELIKASPSQISAVPGISKELARVIYDYLHR